ncbi:MAG TPA: hypothetical protein DDW52_09700 [Planctomycetaceae bacterium]|nr:hypothetical protein [Planctomycetaceae bacterium]
MQTSNRQSSHQQSSLWIKELLLAQSGEACKTIGLVSANRVAADWASVSQIVRQVTEFVGEQPGDSRVLAVHLDVFLSSETDRLPEQPPGIPGYSRSPLGAWREVTVPVPVGFEASWSLLQLPKWLRIWREQVGLILLSLGPCNLVPARAIGRLCSANLLLLGPGETASFDWVSAHTARLTEAGVNVCGSLLSRKQAA